MSRCRLGVGRGSQDRGDSGQGGEVRECGEGKSRWVSGSRGGGGECRSVAGEAQGTRNRFLRVSLRGLDVIL